MTKLYESENVKDNEGRKFQPDALGDVAINVKSSEFGSWAFKAVGNKIVRTLVDNQTEEFSFQKNSVEVMRIRVVYENNCRNEIESVERIV